jgi:hypothetical protein
MGLWLSSLSDLRLSEIDIFLSRVFFLSICLEGFITLMLSPMSEKSKSCVLILGSNEVLGPSSNSPRLFRVFDLLNPRTGRARGEGRLELKSGFLSTGEDAFMVEVLWNLFFLGLRDLKEVFEVMLAVLFFLALFLLGILNLLSALEITRTRLKPSKIA